MVMMLIIMLMLVVFVPIVFILSLLLVFPCRVSAMPLVPLHPFQGMAGDWIADLTIGYPGRDAYLTIPRLDRAIPTGISTDYGR